MLPPNISFLSPLKTLNSFSAGHFSESKLSIDAIWLILAELDVDNIQEEELEIISSYWCNTVNLANIYNITNRPRTTPNLFISYLLVTQVSFSLHKRLLNKYKKDKEHILKTQVCDPIKAPFGLYVDDLFEETEVPKNYPLKNLPIFNQIPGIINYFSERSEIPFYQHIISWSLQFLFSPIFYGSSEQNIYENDDELKNFIKNLIDSKSVYHFNTEASLEKYKNSEGQINFDVFTRDDQEITVFEPLLIRYSLITYLNANVVLPIRSPNPNFYDNFYKIVLNSKEREALSNDEINRMCQTFLYIDAPKIQFPLQLFHSVRTSPLFITLSFLSQTIDMTSLDIFKVFESPPKSQSAILFCLPFLRSKEDVTTFISYLNEKNYSSSWSKQISEYVHDANSDIDKLLSDSLSGDIKAAKALVYRSDCLSRLEPQKSFLHCLLSVLSSNEPAELYKYEDLISKQEQTVKPDIEGVQCPFTNIEAAIIFKNIHSNHKIDVIPLLKQLHESLIQIIEKLVDQKESQVHLLFAKFTLNTFGKSLGPQNLIIPNNLEDFIVDLRPKPLSMIFLNAYMIFLYLSLNTQELSEEVMNQLIDISSISIYDNRLDSISISVSPSFKETAMKRQLYHLYQAIEDKEAQKFVLDKIFGSFEHDFPRILNLPDDEFNKLVLSLATKVVNDKDFDTFIKILTNMQGELLSLITKDIRMPLLEKILENHDSNQIKLILPSLIADDIEVLKRLGKFARQKPKLFSLILDNCNLARKEIFEAVCDFSGEITVEFVQMLKKLTKSVPIYPISFIQPKENEIDTFTDHSPKINVNWSDENVEQGEKYDLWNTDEKMLNEIKGHNEDEHPSFFCYTCGLDEENKTICLNCALKCHATHDIVYYKQTKEPCQCQSKNHCCFDKKETQPKEQQDSLIMQNAKTYFDASGDNSDLLLKLFMSLSNCQIMKPPNPLQNMRLNGVSILDVDIAKFKVEKVPSRLRLISASMDNSLQTTATPQNAENPTADISLLPKLIDMQAISREVNDRMNFEHFKRRCNAFPLKMAAVGGIGNNILVVCNGLALTSYNTATMQQLHTYTLSHSGFQIEFCPIDPSVFAVASLYHVMIFSVTEDGQFEESDQIELMLEAIGPYIFVNSIVWVPLAALQLAVVCNAFIKIYDIPIDRFSPIACFIIDQPDFFSSAAFVEYNDECYGLFAMSNGRIAIQSCNVDASDGPIPLTRFANLPRLSNPQTTISYNADSDLVFISSPPLPLLVMRLDQLFKEPDGNGNPQYLSVDFGEVINNLHMYFIHSACEGSLNFFTNPMSGAVFTIEFIDNNIAEVTNVSSVIPSGGFPFFDRTIITLSTVIINDQFCAIGKNGKVFTLSTADSSVDESEKEDDASDNEDDIDLNDDKIPNLKKQIVSPTFWTNSYILSRCPEIEVQAPGIANDASCLLSGSKITFPGGVRHKAFDITLKDDTKVIVGFRFNIRYSDQKKKPFLKLFHKKYRIISNHFVSIPLMPIDVQPRHKYRISISNNGKSECQVQSLDIFVIDVDKLDDKYELQKRVREYEWPKDGQSVFDYNDPHNLLHSCKPISDFPCPVNALFFHEKPPFLLKRNVKLGLDMISDLMNNVSLALPPEFDLNDNAKLAQLFEMMYSSSTVSSAIRRVILKSSKLFSRDEKRQKEVQKIWIESILNIVKNGKVAEKQWGNLWRDVSLMSPEITKSSIPILWKSKPQFTGCFSVFTAFLTE